MMSQPSYITFRKHTFLSSLAMSLGAIVITLLVSCTVVALYAVHLASEKSEQVLTMAQGAIKGLPEFTKSLPPALSDMLDDRREPQYTHELAISAKVVSQPDDYGRSPHRGRSRQQWRCGCLAPVAADHPGRRQGTASLRVPGMGGDACRSGRRLERPHPAGLQTAFRLSGRMRVGSTSGGFPHPPGRSHRTAGLERHEEAEQSGR